MKLMVLQLDIARLGSLEGRPAVIKRLDQIFKQRTTGASSIFDFRIHIVFPMSKIYIGLQVLYRGIICSLQC